MKKILLLAALALSGSAYAANVTITGLPAASALGGTELFETVQSGSKKATAAQLATYTRSVTTKSDVGLGSVENTALSTWAGSLNITTLGTVATGAWHGTPVAPQWGGTGQDFSASTGFVKFASGTASVASVTKTDVGLSAVENTALSTWTGATSITTLGTIGTGTWNGTAIAFGKGGTGLGTAADDTVLLSTGTAWAAAALPNCVDSSGNHLNYTTATNSFSCGTSSSAGGGGDASTNTATSVDSEVALFSSTTGKILKRATGTGVATLTSGVLSTVTTVPTATALAANGTNCSAGNYPLGVDASGNAEGCTAAGSGGTPGGSTTQVQYNNAGAFAGSAKFIWTDATATLNVGASATAGVITPVSLGSGTGLSLTLSGGGTAGSTGGDLLLTSGVGASGAGGITISTPTPLGSANGGPITITGATAKAGTGQNGATVAITAGGGSTGGGTGGDMTIGAGPAAGGTAGAMHLQTAATDRIAITAAGATTLSGSTTLSGTTNTLSSTEPRVILNQTGASTDLKNWDLDVASTVLTGRTRTDADGAGKNWLSVTRGTTTAISNVSLGNATDNPTGTWLGTGTFTFGGAISANSTISSFKSGAASGAGVRVSSLSPAMVQWNGTDQAANAKSWAAGESGVTWVLQSYDDVGATVKNAIQVTRSGASQTNIALGNTTDNQSYTFNGTGAATFGGAIISGGTKFTATGCTNSATVGGATAGQFTSGTTGTCTVAITLPTATSGWTCAASDLNTATNMAQSASSTTSCTISGTTTSGDIIHFLALGY